MCLSPFCCHTYGVDNDDILNPLATIPASVVVFPVTILTAILIPPHDEVCLTLPIPNDLLVFFEVRLNAFVWCVVLRAEVFRATSMVALKKFGRKAEKRRGCSSVRRDDVWSLGNETWKLSCLVSELTLAINLRKDSKLGYIYIYIHSSLWCYGGAVKWSQLGIGWLPQQSVAFWTVPFLYI